MLNFFIGDTWNNWGVDMALVRPGAGKYCGFGCGSMILFFLKWSLLSTMIVGDWVGSGDVDDDDSWSPLMLLLRLDACSFLSSISRFSTSLISFWMRIKPSCVGVWKTKISKLCNRQSFARRKPHQVYADKIAQRFFVPLIACYRFRTTHRFAVAVINSIHFNGKLVTAEPIN